MRITNEERIRLAARLRDFESHRNAFKELSSCGAFDVTGKRGYLDWQSWQKLCKRLAELIEPEPERTCQIDTSKYENGGTVSCGACGKRIPTKSRNTKTVEVKYPYCPWCGAKIV